MLANIDAGSTEEAITLIVALLGVVGCGVAVYLAYLRNYVGAIVALLVGIVLLFVAL